MSPTTTCKKSRKFFTVTDLINSDFNETPNHCISVEGKDLMEGRALAVDESSLDAEARYDALVSALQYTIGERERLKALLALVAKDLDPTNASVVAKALQLMVEAPSERYQDIFALLLSGCKQGGFFVEFGACDGRVASNTYLLEKHFGWTGILAEPAPVWHQDLDRNRTATIDKRCVSATSGGTLEFHQSKVPLVSSVYKDHKYLGEVDRTLTVPTVSLNDLLKDHGAPAYIDFLSVDCEGHEREALRTFDFGSYKFGFICVEQHEPISAGSNVKDILADAGYQILFPRDPDLTRPPHMQISGIDLFYVPAT